MDLGMEMKISVDFDDTYTKDPLLWDAFIKNAMARGHTVYCVTARSTEPYDTDEVYDSIGLLIGRDNCIFTAGVSKRRFVWTKKIKIDVWIDDSPEMIIDGKITMDGMWIPH